MIPLAFGARFKPVSGQRAATANFIPWSGYWWPMEDGELVLGWDDDNGRKVWTPAEVEKFDKCLTSKSKKCQTLIKQYTQNKGVMLSPLMKFDYFVYKLNKKKETQGRVIYKDDFTHASKWELDYHYIGNNINHRHWESKHFAGKCIGWAMSTYDFIEPIRERRLEGIYFRPADIKGILASLYNGSQFFMNGLAFGTEHREATATPESYADIYPQDFIKALKASIDQGKMLEADLDPDFGVWNYPIYSYEIKYTWYSRHRARVKIKIYFADDEVEIDDIFSTNPNRPDIKNKEYTATLYLPKNWNGDLANATGGKWTGNSVDDHPDSVVYGLEPNWRNEILEYITTDMNQEVNFPIMQVDFYSKKPFVDMLLKRYYR